MNTTSNPIRRLGFLILTAGLLTLDRVWQHSNHEDHHRRLDHLHHRRRRLDDHHRRRRVDHRATTDRDDR